jgi:hypothetical protein
MVTALKNSWAILTLLLFTAVIRGGVLYAMRRNLEQDPDAYREIAENLIRHGEFALGGGESYGMVSDYRPTAYRPPLYPVVLSNLPTVDGQSLSLVKVAGLHLVLGVATVWLTWLTARRLLGVGPPGLSKEFGGVLATPTSRSGLLPGGPPGLAGGSVDAASSATLRSGLLAGGPPGLWWAPLAAGFMVACDPILLHQQTLVMTETLAAFLAILSLWCLARFDAKRGWFEAGLAGGVIGLAVLCRPTFLPWLGLVGLGIMLTSEFRIQNSEFRMGRPAGSKSRGWLATSGSRLVQVAALGVVVAGVVSPWVIRNYREFGKPIATTTHGGYTLLLGNNESFYEWLAMDKSGVPWSAERYFAGAPDVLGNLNLTLGMDRSATVVVPQSEIEIDARSYEVAWRTIAEHPGNFVRACFYRVGQFWSPLPNRLTADESHARWALRYATCAWYCGVYLLVGLGVWRLRGELLRPPWVWGVLLCLAFTVVHTFYWTNLRMRAPLAPFMAIVAAVGAGSLVRGARDRFNVRRDGTLPGG